jgi:hypothetical protein
VRRPHISLFTEYPFRVSVDVATATSNSSAQITLSIQATMSGSTEGIISPATGEILKECQVCDAAPPVPLSLCGGCRVVYYCCRKHQVEDRPTHKSVCKDISTAKQALDDTKANLIAWGGENILTPSYDNGSYGRFLHGGEKTCSEYIRAMDKYATALISAGTQQGLVDALAMYQEMLRLDRGGGINADKVIPGLLIQLDRDQEAYDFCAWFQNNIGSDGWAYKDMTKPMLDLQGADPTKDLELWSREGAINKNIERTSCVVLILARLYFGFRMAAEVQGKNSKFTTNEVFKQTRETFPIDILERHPEWLADDDAKGKFISSILLPAMSIYNGIEQYNSLYWKLLAEPSERDKHKGPISRAEPGSADEARLAFERTYAAWDATPGALKLIMGWAKEASLRQ